MYNVSDSNIRIQILHWSLLQNNYDSNSSDLMFTIKVALSIIDETLHVSSMIQNVDSQNLNTITVVVNNQCNKLSLRISTACGHQ